MKKLGTALIVAVPIVLFGWAGWLVFAAPAEPPFDWRLHMSQADHDAIVATLNHLYTRAAYTITWAIQLGYAAWLFVKWQSHKSETDAIENRTARPQRFFDGHPERALVRLVRQSESKDLHFGILTDAGCPRSRF